MSSRPRSSGILVLALSLWVFAVGCPDPELIETLEITQVSFTHIVVLPGETITMSAEVAGPSGPTFEWTAETGAFTTPTEASTEWTAPETEQLVKVTLTVAVDEQSVQHSLDLLVGYGNDNDGDGFTLRQGDCDDTDSAIYPGAADIQDGIDNDCDGVTDEGAPDADDDGDGFTDMEGDCDDGNDAVFPGASEVPNDIDDDCDLVIDEGTDNYDDDGDGFSEAEGDCNDGSSVVSPGAPEILDGVDNNCNEIVDEGTAGYDDDGDGYTELEGDCNDDVSAGGALAYPGGSEVADGLDNDCDGLIDEDFLVDDDGDGWSVLAGDCDDDDQYTFTGAPEFLDALDNDCDGLIDEDMDTNDDDGDGVAEADGDCDDSNAAVSPNVSEIDDVPVDFDNDCDGFFFVNRPYAVASAAIPSGAQTDTCTQIDVDGAASWDPDGDPLIYYWYFEFQPINSLLSNGDIVNGSSAQAAFTPDVEGLWVIGLIVSDGMFNSDAAVLTYTVDNDSPVGDDDDSAGDDDDSTGDDDDSAGDDDDSAAVLCP